MIFYSSLILHPYNVDAFGRQAHGAGVTYRKSIKLKHEGFQHETICIEPDGGRRAVEVDRAHGGAELVRARGVSFLHGRSLADREMFGANTERAVLINRCRKPATAPDRSFERVPSINGEKSRHRLVAGAQAPHLNQVVA